MAEAKFRSIVEQTMVGVYMLDGERFQYVNARAAEIFGHAPENLLGMRLLSLVVKEDRPLVWPALHAADTGDTGIGRVEFRTRHDDGREVIVGTEIKSATVDGKSVMIGVLQDVTARARSEKQEREYTVRLERSVLGTVDVVSRMMDMRDPYTSGHERRVGDLSARIAAEMGLELDVQHGLRIAGSVHDVGKITLPAEILAKPGRISQAEYELIKGHSMAGYEVLKDVDFPWPIAQIALQHHERMDGSGYPQALRGESIILEARIVAVADVIESMGTHRPYRPALGIDAALNEIVRGRGIGYDANVVDAAIRLFKEKGYLLPT
jgi:PAS domain S-box-containing protein